MASKSDRSFLSAGKYWRRYLLFLRRQSWLQEWQRSFLTTEIGHFYSPFPNLPEVSPQLQENKSHVLASELRGIEISVKKHQDFLRITSGFIKTLELPRTQAKNLLYYSENPYFNKEDALAYSAILQAHKPRKVIEVGSGFSSALAIDHANNWSNGGIEFTFIEPYPDRLKNLLSGYSKNITILETGVQKVEVNKFAELQKNDVLFIDSSHVSKCKSDVNYLFFEILPQLKSGVLVHVHDIFWPFEYPLKWLKEGRCWNEAYVLRALLIDNPKIEIEYFSSMAEVLMKNDLAEHWNLKCDDGTSDWISNSSSIWLRVN